MATDKKVNKKSTASTKAKQVKKTKRRGTRNKYERWLTDKGLMLLEAWARDGLIDVDIAKKMDINPATLYEWKKKYPEINEALKNGKEVVDTLVENALLKRALGYEYEERSEQSGENSDGYFYKTTKTIKEIVPDTTAQIFWLKNRRPDKWRNSDRLEIETSKKTDDALTGLTEALLKHEVENDVGVETPPNFDDEVDFE